MTTIRLLAVFAVLAGLGACGGDENLKYSCDETKKYMTVTEGKRIEAPEGLDPLNELAEMPIPRPEDAPPPSQRCIELPPSVRANEPVKAAEAKENLEVIDESE